MASYATFLFLSAAQTILHADHSGHAAAPDGFSFQQTKLVNECRAGQNRLYSFATFAVVPRSLAVNARASAEREPRSAARRAVWHGHNAPTAARRAADHG